MIVFDVSAPAGFSRRTIACATVSARTPIAIHVFYDRVAAYLDSLRMPGFLGHVIAHEIVHVLQGEARHSREGLMKANWDLGDCAEMGRAPLPFAQEDLELINEHVKSVHVNTARK